MLLLLLAMNTTTVVGRAVELAKVVGGMVSISRGRSRRLVEKDRPLMSVVISRPVDCISGSSRRWIVVGQRVRKRKKRLIGSVVMVSTSRSGSCRCRLLFGSTLIVELTLSLETVASVNDDGHGHDDNEEGGGRAHQNAQERCHLKVECVT